MTRRTWIQALLGAGLSLAALACGEDEEAPAAQREWERYQLPVNAVGDVTVPAEVRSYMKRRAWDYAHDRWHKERLWDMQSDALRSIYLADGFKPFDKKQQGAPGSGVEFLAMHRHMFQELRSRFPRYAELWEPWERIPRERSSPLVPVDARTDLQPHAIEALDRLEDEEKLVQFSSEDELGLYIWTTRIISPEGTLSTNPDPSAGIHDTTLHQRWANARSDVNLSEFSVTHENYIFWKMHGWIDLRWTLWRRLKGLPDTDPEMDAIISAQGREMMESEAHRSDEVRRELQVLGHDH